MRKSMTMKHSLKHVILTLIIIFCNHISAQTIVDTTKVLSLEELVDVKMISASNIEENVIDAPANAIIITKQELIDRGYNNVSEIFDDLPGMDVIRPYGDTYYNNYFRGFRFTIGSPYSVMIDGNDISNLYNGITTRLATIPISNIKQIEIIYGPVSTIHGTDAMMGVVNVITDHEVGNNQTRGSFSETINPYGDNINDFNILTNKNNVTFSLSGRLEYSNFGNWIDNNQQYWLRDEFNQSDSLWGDYLNNSEINPGEFSSPINTKAIDARILFNDIEIGYIFNSRETGYGSVYPQDRLYSHAKWIHQYHHVFFNFNYSINDKLKWTSNISYRNHIIPPNSYDIERTNKTNNDTVPAFIAGDTLAAGETARAVRFTYWQARANSVRIKQYFDYSFSKKLRITSGFLGDVKNLQKAYSTSSSEFIPGVIDGSDLSFYPAPLSPINVIPNQTELTDFATYLHTNYRVTDNHLLNLGGRYNVNSLYNEIITYRFGYIGHFNKISIKLLYGKGFQEPIPRSLYGGWEGSGSDPDLKPEESTTLEYNISYTTKRFKNTLSVYNINNNNNVINFTGGAKNAGESQLVGIDYHINYRIEALPFSLNIWAYYSGSLFAEESKFDENGIFLRKDVIADHAKHKVYFGTTIKPIENISATVLARYISIRNTVETNPIDEIDGYVTVDANVRYNNLFVKGFSIGVRVTNILDTKYYHPGIRDADSGDPDLFPAELNGIGWSGRAWSGSNGWYNSRLIQPKRMFWFTSALKF